MGPDWDPDADPDPDLDPDARGRLPHGDPVPFCRKVKEGKDQAFV